jgi:CheY-like chemotaxis protein
MMVKILFMIDDDQDDREIFLEAINTCNPDLEVLFARDGIEALDVLASAIKHPDVIFLDYNMPRMNGLDCLRQLKTDSKTRAIPTVMYTTSGDREQEKVVLMLGADYYMRKTTSFKTLCTELSRLLSLVEQKTLKASEK